MYVLAASVEGVAVHDLASSERVQSLPFLPGQQPAPDQRLHAAHNIDGSCAFVGGFRKVHGAHQSAVMKIVPTSERQV